MVIISTHPVGTSEVPIEFPCMMCWTVVIVFSIFLIIGLCMASNPEILAG